LTEELGQAAAFDLEVRYEESLDPVAPQLTPEQCVARIQEIQAEGKITFDPGSVEINEAPGAFWTGSPGCCPIASHVRMEISGHTDSQGREEMNLNLSQSRADAVLNGLLARKVLVSNLVAQGYGESRPIASNETEEGREQNRRIEFRLLAVETPEADRPQPLFQKVIDEMQRGTGRRFRLATRPRPRPASLSGTPEQEDEAP
jgi:OmpA-OmpF porin, OOP family